MKKRVYGLGLAVVLAAGLAWGQAAAESPERKAFLSRLEAEGPRPFLFPILTPLLLDYVESVVPAAQVGPLYAAGRDEFLSRLESVSGRDFMDLFAGLYEFYEKRAAAGEAGTWATFPAGPFLVHVRPGSAADRDRDVLAREIALVSEAVLDALDLNAPFAAARAALKTAAPGSPGLIPLRLHASRREPDAAKIRKGSTGSATLGATIVDGAGRLTFDIDILYFNALFLAVIEHEVAHAAVLLATFDVAALTAGPLKGEADLRKAFFAGYKKLPSFLQEGLGDWAFYYRGFHKSWGFLPSPETLAAGLRAKGLFRPLSELLAGDARYATRNRKVYALQAAVFLEHLMKTYGRDKLRQWLFTPEPNGAKTFAGIFGTTLEAAEKEWISGK